jgi:type II restriction enzyme
MWCPDETHDLGQIAEKTYEDLIAELELEIGFGQIDIKPQDLTEEFVSIEAKRIHTQIQIALVEIGVALGFRIWIATNDRSIPVGRLTLGELPGVISSLDDIGILYNQRIKRYAEYIDCIWFKQIEEDSYIIPAIIEIEHSTGVQPGLTRMLKLREVLGSISPKYVIVAPDDQRHRAVSLANDPVSRNLKAEYMPYSTVRVLYGLVKRFKLTNVVDYNFINPFLEHIVE